jgi:hypothetical protein
MARPTTISRLLSEIKNNFQVINPATWSSYIQRTKPVSFEAKIHSKAFTPERIPPKLDPEAAWSSNIAADASSILKVKDTAVTRTI